MNMFSSYFYPRVRLIAPGSALTLRASRVGGFKCLCLPADKHHGDAKQQYSEDCDQPAIELLRPEPDIEYTTDKVKAKNKAEPSR